jgi:hypothetical protein
MLKRHLSSLALFSWFFISILFVSCLPWSDERRSALGLIVIVFPWLFAAWDESHQKKNVVPEPSEELLPVGWILSLGLLTALLVRLKLFSSNLEKMVIDHGLVNQGSMDLSREWDGKFFHTASQIPVMQTFVESVIFKIIPDPRVFDWWTALLTLLAGATIYRLSIRILHRWQGVWLAVFIWLDGAYLYFGLCGIPVVYSVFLEGVLVLLGWELWRTGKPKKYTFKMFLYGLGVGLLAWTYVAAWAMIFGISVWVMWETMVKRKKIACLAFYVSGLSLSLAPYVYYAFREHFGNHAKGVSMFSAGVPWWTPLINGLFYVSAWFWGLKGKGYYLINGFLGPVGGALVLIGLLDWVVKGARPRLLLWLVFAAILPGLFSTGVQTARWSLIIPFMALSFSVGVGRIQKELPRTLEKYVFVAIILGMGCWNGLVVSGWNPTRWAGFSVTCTEVEKRDENYSNNYRWLHEKSKSEGPGYIWVDVNPEFPNPRYWSAFFSINACVPPLKKASWGALSIPRDELPFLLEIYPNGTWKEVSAWDNPAYGPDVLFVTPVAADCGRMNRFQDAMHQVGILERATPEGGSLIPCIREMERIRSLSIGDRLLEAVYWERLALLYRRELRYQDDMDALRKALELGYPAAHLYFQVAGNYLRVKDFVHAREYFTKARQAPYDRTAAFVWLARLEDLQTHPDVIDAARKP